MMEGVWWKEERNHRDGWNHLVNAVEDEPDDLSGILFILRQVVGADKKMMPALILSNNSSLRYTVMR